MKTMGKDIILHPLITEKAVNMIEKENKVSFIVADNSSKSQIREEIEKLHEVKIESINILRDRKGRKKAIVRLSNEHKATDLAVKLGVI